MVGFAVYFPCRHIECPILDSPIAFLASREASINGSSSERPAVTEQVPPNLANGGPRGRTKGGEDWNDFSFPARRGAPSLLTEIERLLKFACAGAYYQLLGLQPGTPRSEVKRRFYKLARRFHPDCHMDHPELIPRLVLLMDSLTTAYKTLADPGAKRAYDFRARASQLNLEKAESRHLVQEFLQNAQLCLAIKNYVGSILWLRRAIEAEPNSSKYRSLLGRSLAAIPEYRNEAVEQFEKAIRLDSLNVGAHFQYAQLLELMKFPLRARSHYVRVMELDPHHLKARERLIDLNVSSPRWPLCASLFNRLIGRH